MKRMKEVRWKKTERRGVEEVFKGSVSTQCSRRHTSVHEKVSLACPNAVATPLHQLDRLVEDLQVTDLPTS